MKTKKTTASRSLKLPSNFVFVLVGPLADAKKLVSWAHEEFRKSAGVLFIGVDRGYTILEQAGLPVSFAIGDFDSAVEEPSDAPSIRLKKEKERSDLSFALQFCAEQGARTLYAYGFQGARADHEFAVHLDLSEASLRIPRVVSIGERGVIFYVAAKHAPLKLDRANLVSLRESFAVRKAKGKSPDWISLFPIDGVARGVRLRGLRFPVLGGILSSSSQGLSNELRSKKIEVDLRKGRVAVFFPATTSA